MGKTVMVVGVGRFGSHYARILSGLNAAPGAAGRPLDRLVLTRTHLEACRRLAEQVRSDPNCTAAEVIGFPVADPEALVSALDRFSPDLTCITAVDPETGDAVHSRYAEIVLRHGTGGLLCEKPLCPTTGDGQSLSAVDRLRRLGGGRTFGLELPMAVVRRQMEAHLELDRRLAAARRLSFYWSTTTPLRTDLIDALALHPWSLIPERLSPERLESACAPGRCDIAGRLRDRNTGGAVALEMALCSGDNARTMTIDGALLTIFSRGPTVSLLAEGTASHGQLRQQRADGEALLSVENPLKQNILACLDGTPVTGLSRTGEAQRFLEMAKGWTGA